MARFGAVGPVSYNKVFLECGLDGKPVVYQLYTPEQYQDTKIDPNLYLWMRKCELFFDSFSVLEHFRKLGIQINRIYQHNDFKELTILQDNRGFQWYCCKAPIYGVRGTNARSNSPAERQDDTKPIEPDSSEKM